METLTVRYSKLFEALKEGDDNSIDMLEAVEKYQFDISTSEVINIAGESIDQEELLYGYST